MTTCNLYGAIQKGLFPVFFLYNKKFLHNVAVYAICATVGCFLCQFGKIAMQMRKNFLCNVCSAREKNHKFHTTSVVYAICAIVGYFLSIWQNCNADAEIFCLQCLQCKREKLQISAQRQPCTQFVQPLGVFCQFGKIAMQMRKNFVCDVCRAREKNHKIPLSWRLFA